MKVKVANSFYDFRGAGSITGQLISDFARIAPMCSCGTRVVGAHFKGTKSFVRAVSRVAKSRNVEALRRTRHINPKGLFSIVIVCPYANGATTGLTGNVISAPILLTTGTRLEGNEPLIVKVSAGSTLNVGFGGVKGLVGVGGVCFIPFKRSSYIGGPGSLIYSKGRIISAVGRIVTKQRVRPMVL